MCTLYNNNNNNKHSRYSFFAIV